MSKHSSSRKNKLAMSDYLLRLALLMCLFGANAFAQDSESTAKENRGAEVQETSENAGAEDPEKASEKPAKKKQSPSRFEPTEEVSEDLSIPFPVDI